MFDDLDYTKGRLVDTIIRVEQEPILVRDLSKRYKSVTVSPLKDLSEARSVKLTDLNLEAVPLGYIQCGANAVYSMRKPMRRDWRQGLRLSNMYFVGGTPFMELPYAALHDTIVGDYPDLKDLPTMLKSGYASVAFHRHWSVCKTGLCHYKGDIVGTFQGGITLDKNYQHLGEYLQETLDAKNHL